MSLVSLRFLSMRMSA